MESSEKDDEDFGYVLSGDEEIHVPRMSETMEDLKQYLTDDEQNVGETGMT